MRNRIVFYDNRACMASACSDRGILMEKFLRCACGDEFPIDSYGAGFLDAKGKCFGCDSADDAAPVELPEPVAYWRTGATDVLHNFSYNTVKSLHWTPLYTDQQLRALLKRQ